jgi:Protein of unknown function (DUF1552)
MSLSNRASTATRRSFLKAAGLGAAALPFYKMLEDDAVRAQGQATPLRFVGVGAFGGTTQPLYARQAGETDTNFDISYSDSPLRCFDEPATYGRSFKEKLLIFEGFDYGCGRLPSGNGPGVAFHGAMGLFLTGSSSDGTVQAPSGRVKNASLDQYLAVRHGDSTPFRSLELCVEHDAIDPGMAFAIAYGEGGVTLPRLTNPETLWDRFFVSVVAQNDPAEIARLANERRRGHSVYDFVLSDLNRLSARVPHEQRIRLDQHISAMRSLEMRLDGFAPGASCSVPPRHPVQGNYVVSNAPNGGLPYFGMVLEYQLELLAEILKCDLTRFVTWMLPGSAGPGAPGQQRAGAFPWGVPDTEPGAVPFAWGADMDIPFDFHDGIAHQGWPTEQLLRTNSAMNRWYYSKVCQLAQRLDDANLLDDTVILVGNEGGWGSGHTIRDVPIVLLGGANAGVRGGRRIVAPGRRAQPGDACEGDWTCHNSILAGVANLWGEQLEGYGTTFDPAWARGVTELT